jgi:hypothetical protein
MYVDQMVFVQMSPDEICQHVGTYVCMYIWMYMQVLAWSTTFPALKWSPEIYATFFASIQIRFGRVCAIQKNVEPNQCAKIA